MIRPPDAHVGFYALWFHLLLSAFAIHVVVYLLYHLVFLIIQRQDLRVKCEWFLSFSTRKRWFWPIKVHFRLKQIIFLFFLLRRFCRLDLRYFLLFQMLARRGLFSFSCHRWFADFWGNLVRRLERVSVLLRTCHVYFIMFGSRSLKSCIWASNEMIT